jgi:hypothetical protein
MTTLPQNYMKSHVNGQNTPTCLAKLRVAIYALIGDQLLFSEAEQLQLSLSAHECADARQLRAELARLRHEVDRRLRVADLQTLAQQEPAFADYTTQRTDLLVLAHYPALHHDVARTLPSLLELSTQAGRLDVMGLLYQMVLKHRGLLSQVLN